MKVVSTGRKSHMFGADLVIQFLDFAKCLIRKQRDILAGQVMLHDLYV